MAHFAEIDDNGVVLRVIVVANKDTADVNGVEKEYIGIAHCEKLLGGTWKQTSYNNNFRKQYARTGMVYNANLNMFIYPQPYPSWSLDKNGDWQPPIQEPISENENTRYEWNEETTSWDVVEILSGNGD